MPHERPLQLNEGILSYRNIPKQVPQSNPWNSSSPRSLRRPEPQVVDWIKASSFHVSCIRRCVNKSTLVVLRPKQPYFAPPLQGCTRPTSRVPTPFDPLSSFTGGGNWTPSGFRHTLVKKRNHRVQTRPTSVSVGPNTIKMFASI